MQNAGVFDLGTRSIAAAVTETVITAATAADGSAQAFIDRLDGMLAATIEAAFVYGAGGTTCTVTVETSIDQGANWIEIARLAFTTASKVKIVNLSGLTPKTTPVEPAVLSDNTVVDGVLGDRMRAKVTSTGTYSGSTSVAVRLVAR